MTEMRIQALLERGEPLGYGGEYALLADEQTLFTQTLFEARFAEAFERFLEAGKRGETFIDLPEFGARVQEAAPVLFQVAS